MRYGKLVGLLQTSMRRQIKKIHASREPILCNNNYTGMITFNLALMRFCDTFLLSLSYTIR